MERTILHCDMNNCYASIECLMNPALRGKPVVVGGSTEDRHGIVLAKSEEAKRFGIRTGEVLWEARNKCRDIIIVPPHYDEYVRYGRMAKDLYYEYSNQVEGFGLDEAWIDCTGSASLFGSGEVIAESIRQRMKKEIGLTVSIGVSFNKIFAKLGSDMKKPDAITVLRREDFREKIWHRDASELLGCGRATTRKLARYGICTIGELARTDPEFLRRLLGINGVKLWQYANGRDDARVCDRLWRQEVKSVGRGTTFRKDLETPEEIRRGLAVLAAKTARALRDEERIAGGLQLHVRRFDLAGFQFQCRLEIPTQVAAELEEEAMRLFCERYDLSAPVRAMTIRATHLIPEKQPYQITIFGNMERHEKRRKVDEAVDVLNRRFGPECVRKASRLGNDWIAKDIPEEIHPPAAMFT